MYGASYSVCDDEPEETILSVYAVHDAYFFYRANTLEAVRSGDWKLRITESDGVELFDLSSDISEAKALAESNPHIVKMLRALMSTFDAELKSNSQPVGCMCPKGLIACFLSTLWRKNTNYYRIRTM